jgi:succinate dehydrogenase / fumarate reductase cytochrome b subunit
VGVVFYLVTMAALFLHLYHGVWSSPRTLGAVKPTRSPLARRVAPVIAILVYLGFSVIPAAVLLGILK